MSAGFKSEPHLIRSPYTLLWVKTVLSELIFLAVAPLHDITDISGCGPTRRYHSQAHGTWAQHLRVGVGFLGPDKVVSSLHLKTFLHYSYFV